MVLEKWTSAIAQKVRSVTPRLNEKKIAWPRSFSTTAPLPLLSFKNKLDGERFDIHAFISHFMLHISPPPSWNALTPLPRFRY